MVQIHLPRLFISLQSLAAISKTGSKLIFGAFGPTAAFLNGAQIPHQFFQQLLCVTPFHVARRVIVTGFAPAVNNDGTFEIKNVPGGNYQLVVGAGSDRLRDYCTNGHFWRKGRSGFRVRAERRCLFGCGSGIKVEGATILNQWTY